MNLVTVEHLTKSYTERLLFDDTAFSINEGEKVGLIGINGTGKSTLLKIVAGLEEPDDGSVVRTRNLLSLIHIYFLMAGDYGSRDILDMIIHTFEYVRDFEGVIPGTEPKDCGNCLDHNLTWQSTCQDGIWKCFTILMDFRNPGLCIRNSRRSDRWQNLFHGM